VAAAVRRHFRSTGDCGSTQWHYRNRHRGHAAGPGLPAGRADRASDVAISARAAPTAAPGAELLVIGRLASGVTLDQARTELNTIGAALADKYPDTNKDLAPYPDPLEGLIVGRQLRLLFWTLLGAVGFVLLIACSNVANLLLARAARRTGEMSVRVAIGASRWQVVRQLLTESVLLAFVAGALGLLLSVAGIRWFDSETQNVGRPFWMIFSMDWRTFGFLFGICIVTGVLFGLAPALHVSRTNVNETLKEGGRSGSTGIRARRWANGLIVAQLALTLVHRQNPTLTNGMGLIARTRAGAAQAGKTLREEMRTVDPDMALFNIRTLDEVMSQQRFLHRVFGTMFSLFAVIALLLAAVGLYAVTAYAVTQHTREIGVRVVLGAAPGQVIALFLRRGAVQLGIGLVIGVAGAFGVGRLLQALLVQTSPRDPLTLFSIVALLTIVATVACIVPARRATSLDPLQALRHE
jgi:hypothetical protein